MNIIPPALCAVVLLLLLIDLRLLRRAKCGLVVLAYDNIGAPPRNCRRKDLWTGEKQFRRQLAWLMRTDFKFISARDLLTGAAPTQSVLLAFRGGYENFYINALPALKELKIPALVFLYADGIGKYDFWRDAPKTGPWQNMLTAEQIKEMKKTGLISFGSCGLCDIDLAAAAPEIAANQISESALRLKNLHRIAPDFFAWPAATASPSQSARLAAAAAYKFIFRAGGTVNALPLKNKFIDVIAVSGSAGALKFRNKVLGKEGGLK
ncbi:MAG: polysaccharide deacetylase family protein [Elusimicrobiota bacterium]|jgi:hypothetical protein|nr:polysaccharide deacetylase family protein [Elusimicrobiota bacterium]